jgi:hypothetical protein
MPGPLDAHAAGRGRSQPRCRARRRRRPRGHAPAQVDGTRNRVLLMRFGVEAYPSIFLLREGKTWQYEEARTVQRVRRRAGPGGLGAWGLGDEGRAPGVGAKRRRPRPARS